MDIEDVWPLFGLTLCTPRLELRPIRDDDLPGLVEVAVAGIHDPARTPFGVPWTDAAPDELARSFARYHWGLRAAVAPDAWAVSFTVLQGGRPVGVQELSATQLATRRTVESGSWLTSSAQGQGLGTEMRAGLLLFAFDVLGAEWAESSAMEWNEPSLAVSKKLGYVDDGTELVEPRPGEVVSERRLRLGRDAFVRPAWSLRVDCSDAVLSHLGVVPAR